MAEKNIFSEPTLHLIILSQTHGVNENRQTEHRVGVCVRPSVWETLAHADRTPSPSGPPRPASPCKGGRGWNPFLWF